MLWDMSNVESQGVENSLRIALSFFSRSSFADGCVGAIVRFCIREEVSDGGSKMRIESRACHFLKAGASLKTCDETKDRTRSKNLHLRIERGCYRN
jgi:hypothetical protein